MTGPTPPHLERLIAAKDAEIERLTADLASERDEWETANRLKNEYRTKLEAANAKIESLWALLVRYQVANYIPEDCDLYKETSAVLAQEVQPK